MMRGRTLLALGAVAAAMVAAPTADAALRLRDCRALQCGRLAVPLDRTGATAGRVSLYVERRRAARRPARGTTLLLAGGPGQPATSTYRGDPRDPYGEFRDMTPRNDILAIDGRGTGRSGLLRCPELERANLVDAGAAAGACARRLGPRRGFYRTSDAVEDIEAVRAELGVERLTIVGVSYGTFLAQAYAAAHPDRVERLLLDSVLDVSGWDPLYRDIFSAVPRVERAVCRRACGFFTDDPVGDLGELVTRLQTRALRGRLTLPNGRRRKASLTRQELFFTMVSGDLDDFLRASFPGAVGSALRGDSAPMLRLASHAIASESGGSPRDFSSALYAATSCEDIAFPWTRFSDLATRFGQISAAVAQIPAASLYPFDADTAAGNDFIRMCRRWPEAAPGPFVPAGPLPDVPVLMLSGEVDLRTPVETAATAAADWPNAQRLTVPGTGHSTLSADFSGCAQRAAARFMRGQSVASRCRRGEPLIPPLPPAPLGLRELRAAPQVPGERGRTISAVDLTLLDVATEFFSSLFTAPGPVVRGAGLRGGRWELDLRRGRELLRLHSVEFLPGLRLSGTVRRFLSRRPDGRLRVSGPGGAQGVLRWTPSLIEGRLDGRRVESRPRGAAATAAGTATGLTRAQVLRVGRAMAQRRAAGRSLAQGWPLP
jgi:pimeloyl-ACP methyl ester carboxylesterase